MAPLEEAGETASSTWDQGRALSTENEAGALGIFDGTWQDGSEDARQSWHGEGRPDSCASVVKDRNASRERPASTSTSGRIVLELWICGLVRRCLGPCNRIPPGGPCRYNQHAFRGRGDKHCCGKHVWSLGKHVSLHSGCGADLKPGRRATFQPREHQFDVPARTSQGVLWWSGWLLSLQQNQTIFVLVDTGAGLNSSCNSLGGLTDSDSKLVVGERVIDPKGTGTFRTGEISITTTLAIPFPLSPCRLRGEMLI